MVPKGNKEDVGLSVVALNRSKLDARALRGSLGLRSDAEAHEDGQSVPYGTFQSERET